MTKVLLVEDEAHVVSFIKKGLSEEGYEVSIALDGQMALDLFYQSKFDVVILDIMIPKINGIEVCQRIRQTNTIVPILFLSALGTSENIVHGLNQGADDYLVKPFKFIELLARLKTLLRRANLSATSVNNDNNSASLIVEKPDYIYEFEDLVIDDNAKQVVRAGKEISLTTTEYRLLLYFIKNKNMVVSRMDILENVWGLDFNLATNVVDVYVNYLRKKVDQSFEPKLIHTVIGMGYVMKNK